MKKKEFFYRKRNHFLLYISLFLMYGCVTTYYPGESRKEINSENAITSIEIADYGIRVTTMGNFDYQLCKTTDPYKAVVKMKGVSPGLFLGKKISNKEGIKELLLKKMTNNMTTALEVRMTEPMEISHSLSGNTLALNMRKAEENVNMEYSLEEEEIEAMEDVVEISKSDEELADESEESGLEESNLKEVEQSTHPAKKIIGVSIGKEKNFSKVMIHGDGFLMPDVFPLDKRIVIDIPDVRIAVSKPNEVVAPVKRIRWATHKEKARIVLDLSDKSFYEVIPLGDIVVLLLTTDEKMKDELKVTASGFSPADNSPVDKKSPAVLDKSDKLISLDFQDADILPIFKLLTDVSGYNMVVHPEVKGKITMKLKKIHWEKVLDLILRAHNLKKIVDEDIISIVPAEPISKKTEAASAESGSIIIKDVHINVENPEELWETVRNLKELSSSGDVSIDMNISLHVKPNPIQPQP